MIQVGSNLSVVKQMYYTNNHNWLDVTEYRNDQYVHKSELLYQQWPMWEQLPANKDQERKEAHVDFLEDAVFDTFRSLNAQGEIFSNRFNEYAAKAATACSIN